MDSTGILWAFMTLIKIIFLFNLLNLELVTRSIPIIFYYHSSNLPQSLRMPFLLHPPGFPAHKFPKVLSKPYIDSSRLLIKIQKMKAQGKAAKDNKVVDYDKITRGEYELHVLIQSTSGLSLESDSSVDAKIGVTAFGKTEYTKVKSNVGVEETFWGEHLYFKTEFENSQQAENQRLLISVYDHNKFTANALVGNYEIDIQRIYSQKNHTLEHSWLALSNVERNYTEITGYIKISASLLGEKDNNVELEVEPIASITKDKKVLIPPQIQRKTYQIVVDVVEGKNIKPADGTTVDSYVGIEFGQIYSVSQTIPKECNPSYKTKVYLPLSLPAVVDNIAFRINDFNFIQKVEVIGSYYLNINELIKNYENPWVEKQKNTLTNNRTHPALQEKLPYKEFRWINFYGPQLSTKYEEPKNVQQFYPKLASYYVGSVLMRVNLSNNSQPEIKREQISSDQQRNYRLDKMGPPYVFRVVAKIGAAINLLDKNRKYKVVVRVGAKEMETEYSPAKNGFCFWSVEKSFKFLVSPIQKCPDIFIYLSNDKNEKICFLRYEPKLGLILEDQWVKLIPDSAVTTMQGEQAGYLKLGVEMKQEQNAMEEAPTTRKLPNPLTQAYNVNRKSGQLVIDLLCGESLIPLDDDGGVDAFFTFNFLQSEVTSSVKNATLNPVYYERLVIDTDVLDQEGCPPIIVNAYDKDTLSNDFLGSTYIDVGEAIKNRSLVYGFRAEPEPFWYELHQNGMVSGRFLASFRLLPNYTQRMPREINIPKRDYQLNLVIMGLRALKNSSFLSVKQPFIEFDFAGLDVQKNTSKEVQESKIVKTEPKEKGRNVNISTVIPAKLSLPANYKYWPSLSAKVRDNVLGEMYQPTIGYFSVNLQNAYTRSKELQQAFKRRKKALMQNQAKIVRKPPRLEGVSDSLLMSFRNFIMKSLNYNWKILDPSMQGKLLPRNPTTKLDQDYIVIFPNYQKQSLGKPSKDSKEEQKFRYVERHKKMIINNGNYMQVGFDNVKTRAMGTSKRNKHYRYVLNQPFQKYFQRVNGHRLGVMDQIPIKVGRIFPSKDTISNIVRNVSKEDTVSGKYKGQLFISEYNQNKTKEEQEFKEQSVALLNMLMRKGKVCMYLYIIEAANLPPKDAFSNSDPYLVIRAGSQKLSYNKEYFNDEPNPQFFKKVYMVLEFPEDSTIDIEVWDYDPVGGDELIGTATVDIEDRIQTKISDSRFNNPIQTHNLTHATSRRPQGLIRFWLDLVPMDNKSLYRQFDISQAAATKFQVRIIVWSVVGMPCNDVEDVSDLYVQCMFNQQIQDTDVHYRSTTGDGNFNWRMVFPVLLPVKNPLITFRAFDKDIVTGDDFLASFSIGIQSYLEEAFETNNSVTLALGTEDLAKESEVPGGKMHMVNGVAMYDRFWIESSNKTEEKPAALQKMGKIQVSIQILTEEEAKRNPAGKGREDPNQHPFLPAPKGRFELSLNPLKMMSQLCGPKFKRQALIALCCLFFLGLVIYGGVTFGGGLVGSLVGRIVAG